MSYKTVIVSESWDEYVKMLERTGQERIVAVFKLGDGSRLEILTVPNSGMVEER